MPTKTAEQIVREENMFGTSKDALDAQIRTLDTDTVLRRVISILSDAQELTALGDWELARRHINVAKYSVQAIRDRLTGGDI